jgi:hypothetical protein
VTKDVGFLNHPRLINERVPYKPSRSTTACNGEEESLDAGDDPDRYIPSWKFRDAVAVKCHYECDEIRCAIPNKEEYSQDAQPARLALLAKNCYQCYFHRVEHSFEHFSIWDYNTEATCIAGNLKYRPPALKKLPVPEWLKESKPPRNACSQSKRRYESECFKAQFQYTPTSTADFNVAPSPLRLAIQFEEPRGMGYLSVWTRSKEYLSEMNSAYQQVLRATPGHAFWNCADVLSISQLHKVLQKWKPSSYNKRRAKNASAELITSVAIHLTLIDKQTSPMSFRDHISTIIPSAEYAELYHLFREAGPTTSSAVEEVTYSQEEIKAVLSFLAAAPKMPVRTTGPFNHSSVISVCN